MEKNPAAVSLGRKGGQKILQTRGVEYMRELSKKAVEAKRKRKMGIDRAAGKE